MPSIAGILLIEKTRTKADVKLEKRGTMTEFIRIKAIVGRKDEQDINVDKFLDILLDFFEERGYLFCGTTVGFDDPVDSLCKADPE